MPCLPAGEISGGPEETDFLQRAVFFHNVYNLKLTGPEPLSVNIADLTL